MPFIIVSICWTGKKKCPHINGYHKHRFVLIGQYTTWTCYKKNFFKAHCCSLNYPCTWINFGTENQRCSALTSESSLCIHKDGKYI